MADLETEEVEVEVGFEIDGDFFRWSVSDQAKDLMLIDKFTQMPAHQFFELIEDSFDRGRGPILLAMIACSVRRKHPEWSVERIARMVLGIGLSDVVFVGGEGEELDDPKSPSETRLTELSQKEEDLSGSSSEKSNGSQAVPSKKSPKTQA